jgi:hypothetical protein
LNWIARAEEICLGREQAEIEHFLSFGKLMSDMLDSKEYKRICRAEAYIRSELARKGKVFPDRYMQNAFMMFKRFTPVIRQQIIAIAMPISVATIACRWPRNFMDEMLDLRRHSGDWQKITEKYLMKKQWVKRDKRHTPVHRANKVSNGLEINLNLKTIKRNGDFDHDAIQDILRNLITLVPNFESDLKIAYQMCGKKQPA